MLPRLFHDSLDLIVGTYITSSPFTLHRDFPHKAPDFSKY